MAWRGGGAGDPGEAELWLNGGISYSEYSPDSLSLGGAGSHPIGLECPEPCLSLACAPQTPARSLRDLQTATAPN